MLINKKRKLKTHKNDNNEVESPNNGNDVGVVEQANS